MSTLRTTVNAFRAGDISRRAFLGACAVMGVQPGLAERIAAQTPSPVTSPVAASRPAFGGDGNTRGSNGTLRVIVWQAPSIAASHSALSDKDYLAAAPVLEPLLHYAPDGSLIANLITEVPTKENGLLANDLSSVTLRLLPDVTWSDGTPFTAKDVEFTWKWVMTASNAATSAGVWKAISAIDVVDEHTVKVRFAAPSVTWFEPFAGCFNGIIYPSHAFNDDPANKNEAFMSAPIGTGPFILERFAANDAAVYIANERYREPNKPAFSRVELKGGGDATSAARAVLQTGDMDYAWNIQVEPKVLAQMVESGGKGDIYSPTGTTVESLNFNFSDPQKTVDGQRSQKHTPHPIFHDKAVRQALNLAVPRQKIADELYGEGEQPTANVLAGLARFDSPNTSWTFDLEKAAALLDEAGWAIPDGKFVREKDGVKLAFAIWSSTTPVRQKTQAILKQAFGTIGVNVEIQSVDASVFFAPGAGNDQNFYHMYWDMDLWTNGPYSPLPISWMNRWYAGKNGENIAQKANDWQLDNTQRYQNPDYDAAYEALVAETDEDTAIERLIELNDLLIADVVEIPIVLRSVGNYALSSRIRNENLANGPSFVLPFWNIANWNLSDGASPR